MESQIINNLSALLAQSTRNAQAAEYFELIKASDHGWQLCASALLTGQYKEDVKARFFCCQVLEHFLRKTYPSQAAVHGDNVRAFLLNLFEVAQTDGEKSFIRNKVAQLFSLAFVVDYPIKWPNFFTDVLAKVGAGSAGSLDVYLRILKAIDTEVVDREVVHSPAEQLRNTNIKDTMREQCVCSLVESWYLIMTTYDTSHPEVVCLCLNVVGLYISWIDIHHIVNDRVMTVLLQFLRQHLLRESACECLYEVICKGMLPPAKTKLIESLTGVLESAGVMYPEQDEEGDFVAKLAKLVNGIGQQLVSAWDKLVRGAQPSEASATLSALNKKTPLMLRFLGDEDDDVSAAVTPFVNEYFGVIKQLSPLTDEQKKFVQDLLLVILRKMKYDDDYNFDEDDEEEAMFQEYRKQLRIIFNTLTSLDNQLILSTVQSILSSVTQDWQQRDWKEVEVGLTLLYMLGEALPSTALQFVSEGKIPTLQAMMRILVASNVSNHPHQAVKVQFFETITRYDKFFLVEPSYIEHVLAAFLDSRGLKCDSKPVRSRASYLLTRFIRTVKGHLAKYTEFILKALEELLVVQSPGNGQVGWLTNEEQMFLYEVASSLIVSSEFDKENKLEFMKMLLSPVLDQFNSLYVKLGEESDKDEQENIAECLNCAMSFACRTSKGFTPTLTMDSCGCSEVFAQLLTVFVQALDAPCQRHVLAAGVRQYFHRMVVCLGQEEMLPMASAAVQYAIKTPSLPGGAKELSDFIPLVNQLITKFKADLAPWMRGAFTPLVSAMSEALSLPIDEQDSESCSDRQGLRRALFTFLSTVLSYDLAVVIQEQDPATMQQILFAIIQGGAELSDPTAQKVCFASLKKTIEIWGGPNGVPGFDDFTIKHIVPACFVAPSKSTFDLNDGQTLQVLNEIAGCLKLIHEKQCASMVEFLRTDYLPSLSLDQDSCQNMLLALKSDQKKLKIYLKDFYVKVRSRS